MLISMKKNKRITAKSVIASILIVALLFNVVSPVYARDGNVGDGNTWTAMAMGAFNGATASSTVGWTQWAVGLFVQVAVDYADLYYFMHNYSDYGRSVISLNIGGAHINITRGQMVRMVASAAASTVAGFATGSGISVGTVVNNLTNSFTRMMISSVVSQILVKKFGLDPNLASIATTLITNYISAHWNFITSIIPQAGTMLDELIDPQDQQLKHTKGFLKKLKAGSDEESKKGEGKSTDEGSDKTFTKEELDSGIKLTEITIANLKKQQAQLSREWWHLPAARQRNEAKSKELGIEINNQESLLSGLRQLQSEVENNSDVRNSPNWAPLKSAQDSIVGGLRSAMDKRSDPVAKAIKKGVDGVVIKGLTIADPSLPKKIEESKPKPITIESKSNVNADAKDTAASSRTVSGTLEAIKAGQEASDTAPERIAPYGSSGVSTGEKGKDAKASLRSGDSSTSLTIRGRDNPLIDNTAEGVSGEANSPVEVNGEALHLHNYRYNDNDQLNIEAGDNNGTLTESARDGIAAGLRGESNLQQIEYEMPLSLKLKNSFEDTGEQGKDTGVSSRPASVVTETANAGQKPVEGIAYENNSEVFIKPHTDYYVIDLPGQGRITSQSREELQQRVVDWEKTQPSADVRTGPLITDVQGYSWDVTINGKTNIIPETTAKQYISISAGGDKAKARDFLNNYIKTSTWTPVVTSESTMNHTETNNPPNDSISTKSAQAGIEAGLRR